MAIHEDGQLGPGKMEARPEECRRKRAEEEASGRGGEGRIGKPLSPQYAAHSSRGRVGQSCVRAECSAANAVSAWCSSVEPTSDFGIDQHAAFVLPRASKSPESRNVP